MATAKENARSPRQRPRASVGTAPSEFRVFESNDGGFHWMIVATNGVTLAQSGSFTSFDDAARAANAVRDGAASAQLAVRLDDAPSLVAA